MKSPLVIPRDQDNVVLTVDGNEVRLTNLRKIFWPELGLTKGDLLQYYADVAGVLLPHVRDPRDGDEALPARRRRRVLLHEARADAAPAVDSRPARSTTAPGNVIDFPMIQDRAALLWVVNLGCIDLNQWYATCDDVDRPDYLHFDLDPGAGATFDRVRETALVVQQALDTLKMPSRREDDRLEGAARLRADRARPVTRSRCGRSRRRWRRSWRRGIRR